MTREVPVIELKRLMLRTRDVAGVRSTLRPAPATSPPRSGQRDVTRQGVVP